MQPSKQIHVHSQPHDNGGMRALAREVVEFYESPAPISDVIETAFFPPVIRRGLLLGALAGALLGLVVGLLLYHNIVIVSGWENLYSMEINAFIPFWLFIGAAFGIGLIGTATLLAAPVPDESLMQDEPGKH